MTSVNQTELRKVALGYPMTQQLPTVSEKGENGAYKEGN